MMAQNFEDQIRQTIKRFLKDVSLPLESVEKEILSLRDAARKLQQALKGECRVHIMLEASRSVLISKRLFRPAPIAVLFSPTIRFTEGPVTKKLCSALRSFSDRKHDAYPSNENDQPVVEFPKPANPEQGTSNTKNKNAAKIDVGAASSSTSEVGKGFSKLATSLQDDVKMTTVVIDEKDFQPLQSFNDEEIPFVYEQFFLEAYRDKMEEEKAWTLSYYVLTPLWFGRFIRYNNEWMELERPVLPNPTGQMISVKTLRWVLAAFVKYEKQTSTVLASLAQKRPWNPKLKAIQGQQNAQ